MCEGMKKRDVSWFVKRGKFRPASILPGFGSVGRNRWSLKEFTSHVPWPTAPPPAWSSMGGNKNKHLHSTSAKYCFVCPLFFAFLRGSAKSPQQRRTTPRMNQSLRFQWNTQTFYWTPQRGVGVSKPGGLRAQNESNWSVWVCKMLHTRFPKTTKVKGPS